MLLRTKLCVYDLLMHVVVCNCWYFHGGNQVCTGGKWT